MTTDHYKTLRVSPNATATEIREAYLKLAKVYHPDVNPGNAQAESKFKTINSAFQILNDSSQRAQYDSARPGYPTAQTSDHEAWKAGGPTPRRAPGRATYTYADTFTWNQEFKTPHGDTRYESSNSGSRYAWAQNPGWRENRTYYYGPPPGAWAKPASNLEIGRAVQQECRDRSRMPSSA
eukprot:TRINITY_DN97193_c0_g1_i2.p1 TRINITY_DN97193_c0_g1~~TRINITY_DN97193_c0_g1_i2.p1  ORF type:complete len:180 (-),score=26.46 TRINITY_DN97193_c0_g1_i2:10-549(-)